MATQTARDLTLTTAPITMLVPGDNPRRKQPPADYITDLAKTMAPPVGVMHALVVRWHPKQDGKLQIIAGENRFKAATLAGLTQVPITVKDWDDDTVLRAQLIENIQRASMHPVDEGEAFKRLIDRKLDTVESLSKAIGKSVRWIYNRIEFTKLIPEIKKAFLDEEITASHAELIARLEPVDQLRLVAAPRVDHDPPLFKVDELPLDDSKEKRSVISVRDLNEWIEHNVRLAVDSTTVQNLLPAVDDVIIEAQATQSRVLQIANATMLPQNPELKKRFDGVLTDRHWQRAGGKSACEFAEKAVIVFGDGQGEVLDVCVNKKHCAKHWPDHQPAAVEKRRKFRAQQTGGKDPATQKAEAQAAEAKRVAQAARWQQLLKAFEAAAARAVLDIETPTKGLLTAVLAHFSLPLDTKPKDVLSAMLKNYAGSWLRRGQWGSQEEGAISKALTLLGVDVAAVKKSIDKPAPEKAAAKPTPAKDAKKVAKAKKTKKAPAARKAGKK